MSVHFSRAAQPVPIYLNWTACEGGYVGLWSLIHQSTSSGWSRVKDCVASEPRFDVLIPSPVRRLLKWFFKLDSKVARDEFLSTYSVFVCVFVQFLRDLSYF